MIGSWAVYAIRCTGEGIYVGISQDVNRRYLQHCRGTGAVYTRLHRPIALLGSFGGLSLKAARRTERQLKSLPRTQKLVALHELITRRSSMRTIGNCM